MSNMARLQAPSPESGEMPGLRDEIADIERRLFELCRRRKIDVKILLHGIFEHAQEHAFLRSRERAKR